MSDENILPLHSPGNSLDNTQRYPPINTMSPDRAEKSPPAATGIAQLTVHIPSSFKENAGKGGDFERTTPARWRTREFYFYYLIFVFAVPLMAWIPISLSQGEFAAPLGKKLLYDAGNSFTSKLHVLFSQIITGLASRPLSGEFMPFDF